MRYTMAEQETVLVYNRETDVWTAYSKRSEAHPAAGVHRRYSTGRDRGGRRGRGCTGGIDRETDSLRGAAAIDR